MVGLDPLVKLGRSVRFVCNVNVVDESFVRCQYWLTPVEGSLFSQVVQTSVTTTDNSPSQEYTHPDDQTTLLHVTPGFSETLDILLLFTA